MNVCMFVKRYLDEEDDVLTSEYLEESPHTSRKYGNISISYIIGQEPAKKVLSVAVYNHYKRISQKGKILQDDVELEKANVVSLSVPPGPAKRS